MNFFVLSVMKAAVVAFILLTTLAYLQWVERKVIAHIALCRPAKLVSYELGFSESVVSDLLTSALRKLGLRNRSELIELHGAIVDEPGSAD